MATLYAGRDSGVQVAGNTSVNFIPAVAGYNLATPVITVTEWEAGKLVQCSIRSINVAADPQTRSEQYLCDENEREERGVTKWTIDQIEINAGNPQAQDTWLKSLTVGSKLFIGQRYGMNHASAGAANQVVNQLSEVEITSIGWTAPEANADGAQFFKTISFAVKNNKIDVLMTAPATPTPTAGGGTAAS